MQLRQCFARAEPFRLKKARKSQISSGFLISEKSQRCSKEARISNLGFKKAKLETLISNSAPSFLLIHIQAFYIM